MKSKLERALEKQETNEPSEDMCFKRSIFYNKHLLDIIALNETHDFLSALEKKCLIKLAMILEQRIMEEISIVRSFEGENNHSFFL